MDGARVRFATCVKRLAVEPEQLQNSFTGKNLVTMPSTDTSAKTTLNGDILLDTTGAGVRSG